MQLLLEARRRGTDLLRPLPRGVQRPRHHLLEPFQIAGLGEEGHDTGRVGIAGGAVHDDGEVPELLLPDELATQFHAVHARHHPVRHHQIRMPPPGHLQGLQAVARSKDAMTHRLEKVGIDIKDFDFIINEENGDHGGIFLSRGDGLNRAPSLSLQ
nr:hypothetical protein [Corallococcus sicarius]